MSEQERQDQGEKMFCKMCGSVIDGDSMFCKICGAKLQESPKAPEVNNSKPPRKSKKGLVIGGICAAAVVLAVVVGLTVSGLFGGASDDTSRKRERRSSRDKVEEEKEAWSDNILMEAEYSDSEPNATVFGSDIQRDQVKTVTFLDSLDDMPKDAWDVSAKGKKKVMAWVEIRDDGFYDLYIGGDGGVAANESSRCLFQAYTNVEEIRMNGNFHTENVTDMGWMFSECNSLISIDISGFDISDTTDTTSMFSMCNNLIRIYVGNISQEKIEMMGIPYITTVYREKGGDPSSYGVAEEAKPWSDNILMRAASGDDESSDTVFGSDIKKDRIKTVTFLDSLDGMPDDAWDVSAIGNGKVYAWVETRDDGCGDLYIGGNDGVAAHADSSYLFQDYTNVEQILINGNFHTENATDMSWMFCGCKNLRGVDVSGFDTTSVKDMRGMFEYCESLTSIDVSGFDTSNVTSVSYMFASCKSLTSLDVSGFDTSNVTLMWGMFHHCESLTGIDVSGFDTSNVTSMGWMFSDCESLTGIDVSGFDTSNVTNMIMMFDGCESLTSLDVSGFDTSNVTNMWSMFGGCESLTSLDVSGFDTSKVTNMIGMFAICFKLTSVDVSGFDTSQVSDTSQMFLGCDALASLDLRNFSQDLIDEMDIPDGVKVTK